MNAKEKMIEGLLKLLTIKDFSEISVSELCVVSDVHRTTFYAYYDNLLELLEDVKDEAINKFKEKNKGISLDLEHFDERIFLNYLYFVKENKDLFRVYLRNSLVFETERDFMSLFNDVILPKARKKYGDDEKMILYITRFFMEGFFAIIKMWINNDFQETPEEIADIVSRIHVIS